MSSISGRSMRTIICSLAAVLALWVAPATATERAVLVPLPAIDEPLHAGPASETAVLAGGCFWGVQAVFQHVAGVKMAVSGYAGGIEGNAEYEAVSTGRTGHAESVEITFDPSVITYGNILRIYFSVAHDPTQLDRQGADVGSQYRSAIFPRDDTQRRIAESYIAQLDKTDVFGRSIATRIEPLKAFYRAESYHQDYATLHPNQPYIAYNDLPKLDDLKRLFPEQYRAAPVLVTAVQSR
jgi:peptide-methionine (S)-S-oxide reductase